VNVEIHSCLTYKLRYVVIKSFIMLTRDQIQAQIQYCLNGTEFDFLGELYKGKVRDNYLQGNKRILVASDRLSAFDRVITTIPFKGQVLNQMAKFWFEYTEDIVKNHVIDFPDPNVVVAKECKALPVEMVVRAYLTGSSSTSVWTHYENGVREFCGNQLPDGMKKDQKFDVPILTPSTKAAHGDHDESVSRDELLERTDLSAEMFDKLADISMELFSRGTEIARKQEMILVDTKYEFGLDEEGEIVLIDEIHTPDSSRFWYANEYKERFDSGMGQKGIDKEYVRLWLKNERGFVGDGEVPILPDEVRVEAARRYIEVYELITGDGFQADVGDVFSRIESNLRQFAV